MLHAFLLECEKSMSWTAFDQRVLRFLSSLVRRVVVATRLVIIQGFAELLGIAFYSQLPTTVYRHRSRRTFSRSDKFRFGFASNREIRRQAHSPVDKRYLSSGPIRSLIYVNLFVRLKLYRCDSWDISVFSRTQPRDMPSVCVELESDGYYWAELRRRINLTTRPIDHDLLTGSCSKILVEVESSKIFIFTGHLSTITN